MVEQHNTDVDSNNNKLNQRSINAKNITHNN